MINNSLFKIRVQSRLNEAQKDCKNFEESIIQALKKLN